jgi:predicted dithiol-disulfide oxidoreductase (DUF899 family)
VTLVYGDHDWSRPSDRQANIYSVPGARYIELRDTVTSPHSRPPTRLRYHTYSTTGRGIEFLMGYYPILDHAPKGRDEGEDWQVWIRRHDEYESE